MPTSTPPAAVTAVPRRWRLVCAVAAAVVVVVLTYVALSLPDQRTGVSFTAADQVAVAGIGLLLGAGLLALGRPRVAADAAGMRVRNLLGERAVPWTRVRAIRFDARFRWATVVLTDDDEFALLAVQAADGERAAAAVEGLRALLAAARAQEPAPPPLLHGDDRRPRE